MRSGLGWLSAEVPRFLGNVTDTTPRDWDALRHRLAINF
jgi:hypothetical protein